MYGVTAWSVMLLDVLPRAHALGLQRTRARAPCAVLSNYDFGVRHWMAATNLQDGHGTCCSPRPRAYIADYCAVMYACA